MRQGAGLMLNGGRGWLGRMGGVNMPRSRSAVYDKRTLLVGTRRPHRGRVTFHFNMGTPPLHKHTLGLLLQRYYNG